MRALLALLPAACAAEAPTAPPAAPPAAPPPAAEAAAQTPCGAAGYANGLIGADIAAVTLPAELNHRVIYPDHAVTEDFVPERLNIHVDEDGTVLRLACG